MAEIALKNLPDRFARLARDVGYALMWALFALGCCALAATIPWVYLVEREPRARVARLRRIAHRLARGFFALARGLGLITVRCTGAWPAGPGLVVANHPTLVDAILVIAHVPHVCCVIKAELQRFSVVRLLARHLGYVSNVDPEQMLRACTERLEAGETLLLFPEATRTTPGEPVRFHHGAAEVAVRSGRPVLPVIIHATSEGYLSKDRSWHDFPNEPVEWEIEFAEPLTIASAAWDPRAARRRLTAQLQTLYRDALR